MIKKIKLSVILLCCFSSAMHAAQDEYHWTSTIQEKIDIKSMATDNAFNLYIAGNSLSSGDSDIIIGKYDFSGNEVWLKTIGGIYDDVAFSIDINTQNELIIGGFFGGNATSDNDGNIIVSTSEPEDQIKYNGFVMKADAATGKCIWLKTIRQTIVSSVCFDSHYDIYYSGAFQSSSDDVCETNPFHWFCGKRQLYTPYIDFNPSENKDLVQSQNAYPKLNADEQTAGTHFFPDIFLSHLSSDGTYQGTKTYGEENKAFIPLSMDIKDDSIYIAGTCMDDLTQTHQSFVIKTSQNCNENFAGNPFFWISGNQVQSSPVDMMIDDQGHIYLARIENFANSISELYYGNITFPEIQSNADGVLTGVITQIDSSGQGTRMYECASDVSISFLSLYAAPNNSIYITGFFSGTADFDKSDILSTGDLTSSGDDDIFLLKLNTSFDFEWVKQIGAYSGIARGQRLLMKGNSMWMSGIFSSGFDFGLPFSANDYHSCSTESCAYVLKLNDNHPPSFTSAVPDAITIVEDQTYLLELLTEDADSDSITHYFYSSKASLLPDSHLTFANDTLSITPLADLHGAADILIVLDDGAVTIEKQIHLTVLPLNDPPVFKESSPQTMILAEDSNASLQLHATDSDNDPITWSIQSQGDFGTASISKGQVFYQPKANYFGLDSFTIQISDNLGGLASLTVNVTINPVNDSPVANAGNNKSYTELTVVPLNASDSFDIELPIKNYLWTQTAGPSVLISNTTAKITQFMSPDVDPDGELLTFQLMVTDTEGLTSIDYVSYSITFSPQIFYITTTAAENGTISPFGKIPVLENEDLHLDFTPNDDYKIHTVWIDGIMIDKRKSYSFDNVTNDHQVKVEFLPIEIFTVSASADEHGNITPSGTLQVSSGQVFYIVPDIGYQVLDVIVDGVSKGELTTYVFDQGLDEHTIHATFKEQQLIVATSDTEGMITPSGNVYVNTGQDQLFTIFPKPGFRVESLIINGVETSGVKTYTFPEVTTHHRIHVTYRSIYLTIHATAMANGAITPNGIVKVEENTDQSFLIQPASGFELLEFIVDDNAEWANFLISDIASQAITATFLAISDNHTLSVCFQQKPIITALAGEHGMISPSGNINVFRGSEKGFSIVPDQGYFVKAIQIDSIPLTNVFKGQNTYLFEDVFENHTITATFGRYTILAKAMDKGSIEPSGIVEVDVDGYQAFTFIPDRGYVVGTVWIDGTPIDPVNEYHFWNVKENHIIDVSFQALPHFFITTVSNSGGSISPSGIIDKIEGDHQVFNITPDQGHVLDELWIDSQRVLPETEVIFTNISENHSISAIFLSIPTYTITSQVTEGGSISPAGQLSLKENDFQLFEIQQDPGYRIKDVIVDHESFGPITQYALIAYKNQTVSAQFEKVQLIDIVGSVRDSKNSSPLPNFKIELHQGNEIIQVVYTNNSGHYSFSQINYTEPLFVAVSPQSNNAYQWQFFEMTNITPDKQIYLFDINMQALSSKGISGYVYYQDKGLPGMAVHIFSNNNDFKNIVITDETGYYEIKGLPSGSDYLVFIDHTASNTRIYYANTETQNLGEIPSSSVFLESQATRVQPADPLLENIDIFIDIEGIISGCLKWHNNQPIPGILVSAWSESLTFGNATMSDENGCYTITGLLPVSEDMAIINGYVVEVVSDALPWVAYQQGIPLPTHRTDIHFYIENQIAISGQILDQYGYGIENVSVEAWSSSDHSRTGTSVSDVNGNYTIFNLLPADDYLVAVYPKDLPIKYFDQVSDSKQAETIIIDHSMVTDINFILDKKQRIFGKVYLNNTIANSGLWLDIVSSSKSYRARTQTDTEGNYEFIGLDPIDYVIYIESPGVVTFQSSEQKPSEVPFHIYLQKGLTVRGSILSNNAPVDHASILMISDNGQKYVVQSNLSSPFNYTFTGLSEGNYHIEINHDIYVNHEESLKLFSDMDHLNFDLQQPTRSMSGIIMGLDKNHHARLNAWSDHTRTTYFVNLVGTGQPLPFEISDLPASTNYRLEIISQFYEYQAYDNQSQWENADLIDLSDSNASSIIFQLNSLMENPSITGFITFLDTPISEQKLIVEALSQKLNQTFRTEVQLIHDTAPQTVAYTLLGLLPSDDYIVSIKSLTFQDIFYPDVMFIKDAKRLNVSSSHSPSQINFTLQMGRKISGIISDSNMKGIENMDISAWSIETGASKHTRSITDGHYMIQGLLPLTDYILTVSIPEKGHLYYHPEGVVRNIDMASTVSVVTEDQNSIDMTTKILTCISGKVIDTSGNGIENVWVEIFSERFQTGNAMFSGFDGQFKICGLPESQDFQISVKPASNSLWQPLIQNGISSHSESVHLILSKKQVEQYCISGLITNINKQPIGQARIMLRSLSDKDFYLHTLSQTNGHFEWQIVPKGSDYIISAYPPEKDNYAIYQSEPFALTNSYQLEILLKASLSISGKILENKTTRPIHNARVSLYAAERDFQAETFSNPEGEYIFSKLESSDDYVLVVHHEQYITARKEKLSPGEKLDFILHMAVQVCGHVKDKITGQGIPEVPVEIYSNTRRVIDGYFGSVVSDQLGRYCIEGIMPIDNHGIPVRDYIATSLAPGFPPMSISIQHFDRPANFFLFNGKENEISGSIENASSYDCYIDIIDSEYGFQVTLPVFEDDTFILDGLSPDRDYNLIFLAFDMNDNQVYKQWAVYNPNNGMDTGGDENSATQYHTEDVLMFQFNTDMKRRREVKETQAEPVDRIIATTPIVQLSSEDLPTTSTVRDIVSRDSIINVEWYTKKEVQGFYHAFNQQKEYQITKRNVAKIRPSKIRKAQSLPIYVDNEYYYFHIASVNDRGRIGLTSTAAFRIDNIAPQNVQISVPIISNSRNIEIQLGASGANEVYISNHGFDHGGSWQLLKRTKTWKLLPGNGLKTIYVRFRDRVHNISQTFASTEYIEPIREYTIETSFDDNGFVELVLPEIESNLSNKRIKDYKYTVPEGSRVQLRVQPDEGYIVDSVSLNNKRIHLINNKYTIDYIDQNQQLKVTFKPKAHIITATSGIYGMIEPLGEVQVYHGDDQGFTFTPYEGTRLAHLVVDGQKIEPEETFQYKFKAVERNHTIMALFVRVFQIDASHGDNGIISPSGTVMVDQGQSQTFQFNPELGYEVDIVNINDKDLPTRPKTYSCLNVSRNHKLYVSFKRIQFMIAATSNTGGSIDPSGNIPVYIGDDQTFSLIPDDGYSLHTLIVDGSMQPVGLQSYTFENITSDHNISVSYKAIEFHIFTTSEAGGTVFPSGAVNVIKGKDQSFALQPSPGYVIDVVLLDDKPIEYHDHRVEIISVSKDHRLHVVFKQIHTLSVVAGHNGQILPSGNIKVSHGETRSFILMPDDGYTISSVTVDNQEVSYTNNTIFLDNIMSDHTIVAAYTPICHMITAHISENGRIDPQGNVLVNEGHSKTFYILPDPGYEILSVMIDSQAVHLTQNYFTIKDVRKSHEIAVSFKLSNQAPIAKNMSFSLFEDHMLNGILQAMDPDSDPLTFTIIQRPEIGNIVISENISGKFLYTPLHNEYGNDAFTFKVTDGMAESATATVDIWITPVNDIPVAKEYTLTLHEDSTLQYSLEAWDVENHQLSFIIATPPQKGEVILNGQKVSYFPNENVYGDDIFYYQVSDGSSMSSPIPVSLTILPVNDPPVVDNQYYRTGKNSSVDISIVASDIDSHDITLTVSSPQWGLIEGDPPELIYIPENDYEGEDFFIVSAHDGIDESLPATITLFIGATDVYTLEDTSVSISDQLTVFGDPQNVQITEQPKHGSLEGEMPNLIYTPAPNYFGDDIIWLSVESDSQPKRIAIYVTPVNDSPVLSVPETIQITEDKITAITIVAYDIENDPLDITITGWSHGHIATDQLPVLEFYPEKDYFGVDTLEIQLSDGKASVVQNFQLMTLGVNDPPIVQNQSISTMEDMPVAITLQAIDIDSTTLNYKVEQTEFGRISGEPPVLIYWPDSNWFGIEQLEFSVDDGHLQSLTGVVDIHVKAVNDQPIIHSANIDLQEDSSIKAIVNAIDMDSDPLTFQIETHSQHGNVDFINASTGEFQYTPKKDYFGSDEFIVTVNDGSIDSEAEVIQFNILPVNDPPVFADMQFKTFEDHSISYSLVAMDPESDSLSYSLVQQAVKGKVALNQKTGALIYTPFPDVNGMDGFQVIADDGMAQSLMALVSVWITPVNDPPVANNSMLEVIEDQWIESMCDAQDIDNINLTFQIVRTPEKGQINILDEHTGEYRYTPNLNANGFDAFVFQVVDSEAKSCTGLVSIDILAKNDPPTAMDCTFYAFEDHSILGQLKAVDVDNDNLVFTLIDTATKGTMTLTNASTGNFVYIPFNHQNGRDELTFQVSDAQLSSNTATISITLTPVNDPPEVNSQLLETNENTPLSITLTGTDIDADDFGFEIVVLPENGTLSGANAHWVYLPKTAYWGMDGFEFVAKDQSSSSSKGMIQIRVGVPEADIYVAEDQSINIVDALGFHPTIVNVPENGTMNQWIYTPNENYNGFDRIGYTYQGNDIQEAIIYIKPVNDPPQILDSTPNQLELNEDHSTTLHVNVLDVDHELNELRCHIVEPTKHGHLEISQMTINYVPIAHYYGVDRFSYMVSDGLSQETKHITITIRPVNDPPIATSIFIELMEDQSIALPFSATDIEQNALSYSIDVSPEHGMVSGSQYWPNENYWGWDRLTYIAHDGLSDSEPAMISIYVRNVNDLPHVQWDVIDVHSNSSVIGQLIASDIDYQDKVQFILLESTTKGQLQLNEQTGVFTYWAYETASGLDRLTFQVNDGTVNSDIAGITIVIQSEPPNIAPIAQDSTLVTANNQELNGRLQAFDIDQDRLMFMISKYPAHGIFIMNNPNVGSFTYYPNRNIIGSDTIEFFVNDGESDSNLATLKISIEDSDQEQEPTYELSVLVKGSSGQLKGPMDQESGLSQYSYSLMDQQGQVVVEHTLQYSDIFIEKLYQGKYRLIILAKDYFPFTYEKDETPFIDLYQDEQIEVTLTSHPGFDPFKPSVDVSHKNHSTGFDLQVIQQNTKSFVWTVNGEALSISEYTGNGTSEKPYVYSWQTQMATDWQENSPRPGDKTVELLFYFYDGITLIDDYTVTYIDYGSEESKEQDKPMAQKAFEGGLYNSKAESITHGQTEFYPLMGTSLNMRITDPDQKERDITIDIPPIPLEYLYSNHPILPTDILRIQTSYYTFGANALATGVKLKLFNLNGQYVSLNPSTSRKTDAPIIGLPILINTKVYQSGKFIAMVCENEETQFMETNLPVIDHGDGYLEIQTNHLSGFGVDVVSENESGGDDDGNCFIWVLLGL